MSKGLLSRQGKSVVFEYDGTTYELTGQPYEPCIYVKKDGVTVRTLHNAFTVYDLPEWFDEGHTISANGGKSLDRKAFCKVIAAAIESDRSEMDFVEAERLSY